MVRINCALFNLYLVDFTHSQGQANVLLNNESINECRKQDKQKYLIHETQRQTFALGEYYSRLWQAGTLKFLVFTSYL